MTSLFARVMRHRSTHSARWSLFSLLSCTLVLTACSPLPYQPIRPGDALSQSGYLDKEIAAGVYVIEVREDSSYRHWLRPDETLDALKQHWKRRAKELCKHGYQGEGELIISQDARLDEFQCSHLNCATQPLVSGIAYCTQRFEL